MANTRLPLHEQVAFATVLLKHKPQGVPIDEYFSALRQAVIEPRDADSQIFDGRTLWHTLFIRMQRQSLDTRAEILALNSAQHSDKDYHDPPRKGSSSRMLSKANTQSKRQQSKTLLEFGETLTNSSVVEQHKDRSLLLRVMFGLGRHPHGLPFQPEGLTHLVCLACEAMLESLDAAVDLSPLLETAKDEAPTLHEICVAIQHIWASVMSRLQIVHTETHVLVDYDMITPQLCPVVHRLLARLHQYCVSEAIESAKLVKRPKKKRRSNTRATISKNVERTELSKHNCRVVTETLAFILNKANMIQKTSTDLYLALAAIFLEHIGSSISFKLFAETNSTENFEGILPPRGLSDIGDLEVKTAIHAVGLEAPYLVEILKALMCHPSHQRIDINSSENHHGSSIGVLRHLQRSLLHGIFDGNHRPFDSAAEPRNPTDSCQTYDPVPVAEDADWFLNQVWDILGWDIILGDSIDMNED